MRRDWWFKTLSLGSMVLGIACSGKSRSDGAAQDSAGPTSTESSSNSSVTTGGGTEGGGGGGPSSSTGARDTSGSTSVGGPSTGGGGSDTGSSTGGEAGSGANTTTTASGGTAGGGGSGGAAGSPGVTEWPARPACGESNSGTDWCDGLDEVVVSVTLRDANDNLELSPGEAGVASITLDNTSNVAINYPCAGMLFDHPGVEVTSPTNPYYDAFQVPAGMSLTYELGFAIASEIPVGTQVHGLVWTDVLNSHCDSGGELEFEFRIE